MEYSKERWVAVFFAVLMATSLVAVPALASGPNGGSSDGQLASIPDHANGGGPPDKSNAGGPPGHDRGESANVTIPDVEANSTVELLFDARDRLERLDMANESTAEIRDDAVESITESADAYRQQVVADSPAAFDHIRTAQRSLDRLSAHTEGETATEIERANNELSRASNLTARIATREAYELVAEYDSEFDNRGQRQSAESALGNAGNAIERGDAANGADATTQYRNAWKQADRAITTVESNVAPELSLTRGPAVERNGTVRVQVQIRINDVRQYAYDEAEVTVDSEESRSIDLSAPPLAGGLAGGVTTVELDSTLENRTLTVSAVSTRDSDRAVEETLTIDVNEDEVVRERPDSDEYQEVSVSDSKSGVTVDVGGDGLHERDISITDRTPDADRTYRAGPVVHIENRQPIDRATVEIPIDSDVDPDENLSVVKWDPHDNETWRPVETTIDADEGVAIAEVESFSYFSVFLTGASEPDNPDRCYRLPGCDILPLEDEHLVDSTNGEDGMEPHRTDFVFVMDESGSMSGSPISHSQSAAKRFVAALLDGDRAGLVGYDSSANLRQGLTDDHDALNRSIESLSAGGGTDTEAGLRTGLQHLEQDGMENRSQVIILLSDGRSNSDSYPRSVAEDAADRGVQISTVGLGNNIDENELQDIADITGGDYYHVADEEDLPETFERVAENQSEPQLKDTSNNGIPDAVADANLFVPDLNDPAFDVPLYIDPTVRDTSGDGLPDDQNVDIDYTVFRDDGEWKLRASIEEYYAQPSKIDTDGDGLSDYDEYLWGTEPLHTDTSSDGLIDPVDPAPNTYSSPPDVRYSASGATGTAHVRAKDENGIDSVTFRGYYDPYWGDAGWDQRTPVREFDLEDWNQYNFEITHGLLSERPEEFYLNVTDEEGHTVSYHAEQDSDYDGYEITSVSVVTHGTSRGLSNPVSKTVLRGTGIAGVVLSAWGMQFEEATTTYDGGTATSEPQLVVPTTATRGTWETPDGLEITLPSGAAYEHEFLDGRERKHGWEQIKELPGIYRSGDLAPIIEAPNAIENDGRFDLIIGDNPSGDGQIILRVLNGMIISATAIEKYPNAEYGDHADERTEETVLREEQWEHIQNDHQVTKEEIRRTIENPDEVWVSEESGGVIVYMWVKIINGEEVIVRGAYIESIGEVRIGTSFKPERGYDYVREWIQGTGANQIYP